MAIRASFVGLSVSALSLALGCGTGSHEEPYDPAGGEGGAEIVAGGSAGTQGGAAGAAGSAQGGSATGGQSGSNTGGSRFSGDAGAGGTEVAQGGASAGTEGEAGGSAGAPDMPVLPENVIRPARIDKLDLVFMIDNSISMADKQEVLRDAVPLLMQRLVTPQCLDEQGAPTGIRVTAEGSCPHGQGPEFEPVRDIHIAIVTSSLGAHGGQVCDTTRDNGDPSENDRAYPLGLVRPALANVDWDDTGFLAWDPDAASGNPRNTPPGTSDANALASQFQNMVDAVGEVGCGYESSLESWYRFLIDPKPPLEVKAVLNTNGDPVETVATGVDTTLLELRERFLRPDSLVAVTMLSDENDCSIMDEGQSWLVGLQTYSSGAFSMPRSTSICNTDPDSPCCTSCAAPTPSGCSADPTCANPIPNQTEDNLNLRCYRQKQRFGFDLLQPLSRYVDGLTQNTVADAAGNSHPNPLYAGSQRDGSMVFLVGILGVPWQDVATTESLAPNAPLEYLSYDELEKQGRFDWILPANAAAFPEDGLMHETSLDRTTIAGLPQLHPATQSPLVPSGTGPASNPINGKETTLPDNSDLQFSCIYPLRTPKQNCTNDQANCDCRPLDASYNRAICDGDSQVYGKAYPATRQLQVLRDVGAVTHNAVVASICPKVLDSARRADPSYGYTPAVSAIVERLRRGFQRSCLVRTRDVCRDGDTCADGVEPGQIDCAVIESLRPSSSGTCAACTDLPGRKAVPPELLARARKQLEELGDCGGTTGIDCEDACLCALEQLEGADLETCQNAPITPVDIDGFCYVDPTQPTTPGGADAAETIVSLCPDTKQRMLRFAGRDLPSYGSTVMLLCAGDPP